MKTFCKICKHITNFTVLHQEKRKFDNKEEGIYVERTWQIIECNGCEDLSFREVLLNSDDINPEDGTPYIEEKIYPVRGIDILQFKNYFNVNLNVRKIYRETIDAFNNGMYILCAGGLRAILDGICINKQILDGPINDNGKIVRKKNLQGKISGLHEKGYLTQNQAEILHEHRFLGNEALHSLDQPSKEELKLAIEIIEHTLDNIYELSDKVEELRFKKSQRKKSTP